MNFHAAMVVRALPALYQSGFLAAGNQRDNTIWRCLQACRQLPDCRPVPPRKSLDVQEQKVLQWRDAFDSYRLFGETQEAMKLVTKLRQLLETSFCYSARAC